ncbi:flagellar hook-associated protein 1 FlgK [Thermodesulfobium acidiphilum]|uniref:Flagellar hook-associated protein 1 n=1 Tax=Thermodesulfobium acidiphilum TaxID=1794699 RepID=A0A2R4W2L3_THEAF|nr:flagellar hook-associated protein FlgK [Thermodesulfobium acidiphilum]AWB10995.1 flagellar hook-associated protein 1 FlgK [Thermodesulfobium acidiphilum]
MSTISSFLGLKIAESALSANQLAMDVTGHNVANANTANYSRQSPVFVQNTPLSYPTSGEVGTGVNISTIKRYRDSFIDAQLRNASSLQSYYDTSSTLLQQVQTALAEPSNSGLQTSLQNFFSAFQSLANNPSDLSTRQLVISDSQNLIFSYQSLYRGLIDLRNQLNSSLSTLATNVNTIAQNIYTLNKQIAVVSASGQQPNDLMDQRDNLIDQLAKLVNVNYATDQSGNLLVSIGGHSLVSTAGYDSLTVIPDASNPSDPNDSTSQPLYKLVWSSDGMNANVSGGQIGATLDMRDINLVSYLNQLNSQATSLMSAVNYLNSQGYPLNSSYLVSDISPTLNFFTGNSITTMGIDSRIINNPALIGASSTGGSGDGQIAQAIANLQNEPIYGSSANRTSVEGSVLPVQYLSSTGYNLSSANMDIGSSGIYNLDFSKATTAQRTLTIQLGGLASQSIIIDQNNFGSLTNLINDINSKIMANNALTSTPHAIEDSPSTLNLALGTATTAQRTLTINGVNITADAANYNSINDLINDINTKIAASSLSGHVQAYNESGLLGFKVIDSTTSSLSVSGDTSAMLGFSSTGVQNVTSTPLIQAYQDGNLLAFKLVDNYQGSTPIQDANFKGSSFIASGLQALAFPTTIGSPLTFPLNVATTSNATLNFTLNNASSPTTISIPTGTYTSVNSLVSAWNSVLSSSSLNGQVYAENINGMLAFYTPNLGISSLKVTGDGTQGFDSTGVTNFAQADSNLYNFAMYGNTANGVDPRSRTLTVMLTNTLTGQVTTSNIYLPSGNYPNTAAIANELNSIYGSSGMPLYGVTVGTDGESLTFTTSNPNQSIRVLGEYSSVLGFKNYDGSFTVANAYISLTSNIGTQGQQATTNYTNQSNVVTLLQNQQQSIQGVSMNEEMTNLIQYQTAYSASARVINAINSMLDKLINATG